MQDLISRQAALKICRKYWNPTFNPIMEEIEQLPSAQLENQVHLCDSCRHVFPECPSEEDDVIFGNGKGNDNICACNKYEQSAQPEQRWIPCSKRLPEAGVRYQVTFESGEVGYADFRNKIFLSDGSAKENVWEIERYYEDDGEVIAWMPLPEKYSGE